MSNAVAQAALTPQTFPLGTVAGVVRFALLDVNNSLVTQQDVTAGPEDSSATTTFGNVAPGMYTVRVTRLDAGGNAIQAPLPSAPFSVNGSTTTITVATSVVVNVQ